MLFSRKSNVLSLAKITQVFYIAATYIEYSIPIQLSMLSGPLQGSLIFEEELTVSVCFSEGFATSKFSKIGSLPIYFVYIFTGVWYNAPILNLDDNFGGNSEISGCLSPTSCQQMVNHYKGQNLGHINNYCYPYL